MSLSTILSSFLSTNDNNNTNDLSDVNPFADNNIDSMPSSMLSSNASSMLATSGMTAQTQDALLTGGKEGALMVLGTGLGLVGLSLGMKVIKKELKSE